VSASGDTMAAEQTEPPAFVLARWAMTDERPATTRILQVLGGQDARD
jgi:hypothetical protein